MNEALKAEYLANLQAEEVATVKSIAFWHKALTSEIMGRDWRHDHLDGLQRQLASIQDAISVLKAPDA